MTSVCSNEVKLLRFEKLDDGRENISTTDSQTARRASKKAETLKDSENVLRGILDSDPREKTPTPESHIPGGASAEVEAARTLTDSGNDRCGSDQQEKTEPMLDSDHQEVTLTPESNTAGGASAEVVTLTDSSNVHRGMLDDQQEKTHTPDVSTKVDEDRDNVLCIRDQQEKTEPMLDSDHQEETLTPESNTAGGASAEVVICSNVHCGMLDDQQEKTHTPDVSTKVDEDRDNVLCIHDLQEKTLTPKSFVIAAFGKSGVGKSSAINCLLGTELLSVTDVEMELDEHQLPRRDVLSKLPVTVYEYADLQDGKAVENNYLDDVGNDCANVDLILYCVDITMTRWLPMEVATLRYLTKRFGEKFWKKCILLLTKADMLRQREMVGEVETDVRKGKYFERVCKNLSKTFRETLKEQGVPETICESMPMSVTASPVRVLLPNDEHFITGLWFNGLKIVSPERKELFIEVTSAYKRLQLQKPRAWGFLPSWSSSNKCYSMKPVQEQRKFLSLQLSENPLVNSKSEDVKGLKECFISDKQQLV